MYEKHLAELLQHDARDLDQLQDYDIVNLLDAALQIGT
jgi:hypothetical protein